MLIHCTIIFLVECVHTVHVDAVISSFSCFFCVAGTDIWFGHKSEWQSKQPTMGSNTDGDNPNLSCGENDISDELKIAADETYDTRSEVSSSSSNSDSTHPTISTVSSKSSRGDNKRSRRNRSKRARSRDDSKSSSPEPKRARSKESKGTTKSYDYSTKLNYLFRDARFDRDNNYNFIYSIW